MTVMAGFNGDSYCGIYCGACSVARFGQTGRADAFVACMGDRVPAAGITCRGCKSGAVYAGCRLCRMRDCAVGRGLEHCGDCGDFPCATYRRWFSGARLLPHVSESMPNLEAIRQRGVGGWLSEQDRRWSCPGCGEPFSWYQGACPRCGRAPGDRAYTIGPLRKLFFRVLFPYLYRKGMARTR
jgi:hypothetical protein